jgi:hypothetical protein
MGRAYGSVISARIEVADYHIVGLIESCIAGRTASCRSEQLICAGH